MDTMRQSVCLVVNPITVDRYYFLFNCTRVTVNKGIDGCTFTLRQAMDFD